MINKTPDQVMNELRKYLTYCSKCGAIVPVTRTKIKLLRYDKENGQPIHKIKYEAICPNKKRILDGHYKRIRTYNDEILPLSNYIG